MLSATHGDRDFASAPLKRALAKMVDDNELVRSDSYHYKLSPQKKRRSAVPAKRAKVGALKKSPAKARKGKASTPSKSAAKKGKASTPSKSAAKKKATPSKKTKSSPSPKRSDTPRPNQKDKKGRAGHTPMVTGGNGTTGDSSLYV